MVCFLVFFLNHRSQKKRLLFSQHLQCEEIQNGLYMLVALVDMVMKAMGRWIMNSIVAQFFAFNFLWKIMSLEDLRRIRSVASVF